MKLLFIGIICLFLFFAYILWCFSIGPDLDSPRPYVVNYEKNHAGYLKHLEREKRREKQMSWNRGYVNKMEGE